MVNFDYLEIRNKGSSKYTIKNMGGKSHKLGENICNTQSTIDFQNRISENQ